MWSGTGNGSVCVCSEAESVTIPSGTAGMSRITQQQTTRLPRKPLRVALIQNCAGADAGSGTAWIEKRVDALPDVDLVALPEVFAARGSDADYRRAAEPLRVSATLDTVARWARQKRAWFIAGSVIESAGRRVYNTCVVLDRHGRIHASYRKIHLFEARLQDGRVIRESDAYSAGHKPVMTDVEGWRAGLSICYDLRFPELFRQYSRLGAHILFVPSNFTQRTGKDHWEVLVRARAIENQCFVVAPNQCGKNPKTGVASHGHSMVVGPWGEVLVSAGNRPSVRIATLDPAELRAVRHRIPALTHRKM
jgi:predicted amidohydrolase